MSKIMAGKKEVSSQQVDPPQPGMVSKKYTRGKYVIQCWHKPGVKPDQKALEHLIKCEVFRRVK